MLKLLLVATLAQAPSEQVSGEGLTLQRLKEATDKAKASEQVSDEGSARLAQFQAINLSALALETPESPRQIQLGDTVLCLSKESGGEVQVSCDAARKECLVASMQLLDKDGKDTETPVQRASCKREDASARIELLRKDGYRFVVARPNAPPGWYRDERGRVMQANFDFTRRVYVGGGWSPSSSSQDSSGLALGRLDFGIAASIDGERMLHQFRLLEGSLWFGLRGAKDLSVDVSLARYWFNFAPLNPPLYLTTFVGKPRRFDLPVSFSAYFDAGHLEALPQRTFVTIAAASALMDVWHSSNLESYVRLRAGVGAELPLDASISLRVRPEAALETELALDSAGFHHVVASVTGEKLFLEDSVLSAVANPWRFRARLGYEVILLAINDYPLTLVLDGRATYREDLRAAPTRWDVAGQAGLRMSFWAPPRRSAGSMGPGPSAPDAPAPETR